VAGAEGDGAQLPSRGTAKASTWHVCRCQQQQQLQQQLTPASVFSAESAHDHCSCTLPQTSRLASVHCPLKTHTKIPPDVFSLSPPPPPFCQLRTCARRSGSRAASSGSLQRCQGMASHPPRFVRCNSSQPTQRQQEQKQQQQLRQHWQQHHDLFATHHVQQMQASSRHVHHTSELCCKGVAPHWLAAAASQ
jgi:hypothetical protein